MHQPAKHISVPQPFESGNVIEWLNRFDICAKANGWDAAVKPVKLPTLLEGEALAVWLDLTKEQQSDYSVMVDKLKSKLAPIGFSLLEAFYTRKLQPGWRSVITFSTKFETKVSACGHLESNCYFTNL